MFSRVESAMSGLMNNKNIAFCLNGVKTFAKSCLIE